MYFVLFLLLYFVNIFCLCLPSRKEKCAFFNLNINCATMRSILFSLSIADIKFTKKPCYLSTKGTFNCLKPFFMKLKLNILSKCVINTFKTKSRILHFYSNFQKKNWKMLLIFSNLKYFPIFFKKLLRK